MSEVLRYWPIFIIAALMIGLLISFFSGIWIIFVAISAMSAAGFAITAIMSIATIGLDLACRRELPATLVSLERGSSIESRRDPNSSNLTSDTKYEVRVRYLYEVAGTVHVGLRYGRATVFLRADEFDDLERALHAGRLRAHVWINSPTDAFLDFQWAARLVAVLFGVLGAGFFALPAWLWWHRS